MAEIKIAGVIRAAAFSPNHIGNDAAIFNLVADQLRKRGCEVNTYSEEQLIAGAVKEKIIVNMCREQRSMIALQKMEDNGTLVINSGYGIENCTRERMTRILVGHGIPHPESLIVDTDEAVKDRLFKLKINQCWVKRGDSHTMHKEDVSYARHPQEAQELLQEYFMRGIKRAVISRHIEGDLIKFYGVVGTPFFYWFYPKRNDESNSHSSDETLNINDLKQICAKVADALDLKVYGGDCIVDSYGNLQIVSFCDWPSFVPCRNEAAIVLAKMIMNEIKKFNQA